MTSTHPANDPDSGSETAGCTDARKNDDWYGQACELYFAGETRKAKRYFSRTIDDEPDNLDAWVDDDQNDDAAG
jgi:hypothetical protein